MKLPSNCSPREILRESVKWHFEWLMCPHIEYFIVPFFSGFISNLTIQRQHFPNDEDQTGAAKALIRLQDTYRLDANTISTGNLPGKILRTVACHT